LQGLPAPLRGIKDALDGDLYLELADGTILRFDPPTETIVRTVTSGGMLLALRSFAVVPPPVTPPVVSCSVETDLLWPPNHKLVDVGLQVSVQHEAETTLTVEVFSDEDDLESGSGNHAPDAVHGPAETLSLRAERSGQGDGRVYLVVARAADAFGNSGSGCCAVVVPKSMSAKSLSAAALQAASAEQTWNQTGAPPTGFVPVGEGPGPGATPAGVPSGFLAPVFKR